MGQSLVDIAIAWLPLVIVLGVWFWIMRRNLRGPDGLTQGQYMHQIVEETRRQNEALLKLLQETDARLKRLEDQAPPDRKHG